MLRAAEHRAPAGVSAAKRRWKGQTMQRRGWKRRLARRLALMLRTGSMFVGSVKSLGSKREMTGLVGIAEAERK